MANKPFSQYYAEALASLPQAKAQAAPVSKKPVFHKFGEPEKEAKPFNLLDWGIDIISRPLYGVTEQWDSILDAAEDIPKARKKMDSGDVGGAVGDIVGAATRSATAGARGFFSTDPDDKRLSSELIERSTDVIGKNASSDYVDVQDNVNPWTKGIGGFIGDVALDPLNVVPGAVFARPIKAAWTGVKGASKARRAAKEVVEETPVGVGAVARGAEDLEEAARAASIPEPVAPTARPMPAAQERNIDLGGEAPAPGRPAEAPKIDIPESTITPEVPKVDRSAELGAQTSFNAGVKAAKTPGGDAIDATGFAHPEAFEAGRAHGASVSTKRVPVEGRKKAFTDWYVQQAAEPTTPVALTPETVADKAHEVLDTPAPPKTPQDFGFPDPAELVARAQEMVANLPLTKRGTPTVAGIRAAMKEIREDPLTKELLDVTLEAQDEAGEVTGEFAVGSWIDDLMRGQEPPENVIAAMQDGLDQLTKQGRFAEPDLGPATVREGVEELAPAAPVAQRPSEVLTESSRFSAATELMSRMAERPAEGPTFGEFVLAKARADKAASNVAVQTPRGALMWREVPAFLKGATKESDLYKEVLATLTKSWKGTVSQAKGVANKWNSKPGIERFSEIVKTEDGIRVAEDAMGIAVTSRLKGVRDPGKFAVLMEEIGRVIDRTLNLDTIAKEGIKYDTTKMLLREYGIEPDDLTPVQPLSPSSHVTEAVGAAEQAADLSVPTPRPDGVQAAIDSAASPEGGQTLAQRAVRLNDVERDVATVVTREIGRDIFGIGLAKGEKRPFHTTRGAARTSAKRGKGFAVWEGRVNGPTQHNISVGLFNQLGEWIRKGNVFRVGTGSKVNAGREYAREAKKWYQDRAYIVHKLFEREGVAPHLGVAEDDVMLSDWQLRAVLDGTNKELATMLLYNLPTGVPTTNLYAATAAMLRGADDAELLEILVDVSTKYQQNGKYLNPLAGQGNRYYGHKIWKNGKVGPTTPGSQWVRNPKYPDGYFLQYSGDELAKQALNLLKGSKVKLIELANANAAAYNVRIGMETAELTAAARARLEQLVTNPSEMGVAIRAAAEPEVIVQDMAKDAGATQEAVVLASLNTEQAVPVPDLIASKGAAEAADKQKSTGDPKAGHATAQKTHEGLVDDAAKQIDVERKLAEQQAAIHTTDELRDAGVNDDIADISRQTQIFIDISTAHKMNPNAQGLFERMGKAFKANWGQERISRFRHSAEVASGIRRSAFFKQIRKLVADHGGAVKGATSVTHSRLLKQAWNDIKAGQPSSPEVAAARRDLESIFGTMFDVTRKESVLGNVFFRNPVAAEMVNGELLRKGLKDAKGQPIMFDFAAAADAARLNGTDQMTEMIEQWRTWDIDDPAEAMLKLFTASEEVSTKAVIGQDLRRFAAKEGLSSTTPKPGFGEPMASGKSIFISMLSDYNPATGKSTPVYYDKEILKEISNLEAFIGASRSFEGGPGKFVHSFFDPMQQSWKFGMTVARPGHHVRNLVGDASMTYLAEGIRFARKSTTDAIKVLSAMRGKYDGYDFNRALEGMQVAEVPGGTDVLMSGRYGNITIQQAYDAAYKRGILNTYRHSEDVLDESLAPAGFARFMNRISLRGGKFENFVGGVSESRDHFARMQHFLQYVYKAQKDGGKGAKLEDLFDNAAHVVKKYHPDGTMLTPFEAKYLRRVIPFYSWLRGAIPAMLEAAVIHPARVSVFHKASYNLSVAMGVNPDSLENPFPEDQMFPSFLADQAFGPQFGSARDGYFGFSPGISSIDVANQFLVGPSPQEGIARTVAGMTSPVFRVPLELMAGGTFGTGSRINDASDYIDQSLPGVNYIANLTGTSVTGSAASFLQGKGPDPQLQVSRGNKGDVDKALSALNWLTGAQVQNMSRKNLINYAEIEKRNAAAQSGEEARGAF